MKLRTSAFLAALLLVPSMVVLAGDPVTIPIKTYKAMKKGKKLYRVWRAPDFDGSQGFQLGKMSNESEDDAHGVLQDLPIVLKRQMRSGSPYTLHLAVIAVRVADKSGGYSEARVDVEGRVVDEGGKLVAAFETRGTGTIGGNKRDNIRFAVNEISSGLAKDLFTIGLPGSTKTPEVIVAAPGGGNEVVPPVEEKPSAIIIPAPAPVPPPQPAVVPAAPGSQPPVAGTGTAAPAPQPPPVTAAPVPTTPVPAAPAPAPLPTAAPASDPPAAAPKSPIAEALPASITENMKKGSALDKLWISPAYDKAGGFSIGEVRYLTDQRDDVVSAYLPDGLAEIARKDAPCALHLGVTALTSRAMVGRSAPIRIKVEGRLIAKDGTIVAAFASADRVQSTDDRNGNYRELARKIVLAIGEDLR